MTNVKKTKYYSIKVIRATFPNSYHVVNDETKITHSSYRSMEQALENMRDLNRSAKLLEKRKVA